MEKFEDIINGQTPVLVDFYADWCGPCKTMEPVLKQLKSDLGARVRILKINVDTNQALSQVYGVQTIPNFLIFKKGKMLWQKPGTVSLSVLKEVIQDFQDINP